MTLEQACLALVGGAGAGNIGVTPASGITATNAQAALAEIDVLRRAADSSNSSATTTLTGRVSALESAGSSGVIGKDTQANLYADLAWGVGTVALLGTYSFLTQYWVRVGSPV